MNKIAAEAAECAEQEKYRALLAAERAALAKQVLAGDVETGRSLAEAAETLKVAMFADTLEESWFLVGSVAAVLKRLSIDLGFEDDE